MCATRTTLRHTAPFVYMAHPTVFVRTFLPFRTVTDVTLFLPWQVFVTFCFSKFLKYHKCKTAQVLLYFSSLFMAPWVETQRG